MESLSVIEGGKLRTAEAAVAPARHCGHNLLTVALRSGQQAQSSSTQDIRHAFSYRALWARAAATLAAELSDQSQSATPPALAHLSQALHAEAANWERHLPVPALEGADAKTLVGRKYELLDAYAGRIAAASSCEFEAVRELLIFRVVQALNSRCWKSFEAHINAPQGRFVSRLIPLNAEFGRETGILNFSDYGFSGKSSGTIKADLKDQVTARRLTNGWYTALSTESGRELFGAFRSGTTGAYGISNPELREAASRAMAQELLLAAVAQQLSALKHSGCTQAPNSEPIRLTIVSLELQTDTRPKIACPKQVEVGSADLDLDTLAAQTGRKAMQSLNGMQTIDLLYTDPAGGRKVRRVNVEVEVVHFNFPTHERSFMHGDGFGPHVLKQNQIAFERMVALAESGLQQMRLDPRKAGQREQLEYALKEAREIFETGAYAVAGQDPYKMNSRLAYLAWLCGATVHFNCRSGKDRTGMLDAEVKAYAAQLTTAVERGVMEIAPSYKRPLSSEEKELLRLLILKGGNVEVQTLNTGVPGSKLKSVTAEHLSTEPLVQRVGPENWAEFKGLSQAAST